MPDIAMIDNKLFLHWKPASLICLDKQQISSIMPDNEFHLTCVFLTISDVPLPWYNKCPFAPDNQDVHLLW